MNLSERLKENNAIIDHLAAALKIVREKCSRCSNGMCMGCNLDVIARGMLPDLIEHAMDLAGRLEHERGVIVNGARESIRVRTQKWNELVHRDCSETE